MIEKLIYGAAALIFVVGVGFYLQHIWSDCLEENSFFTCGSFTFEDWNWPGHLSRKLNLNVMNKGMASQGNP